MMRGAIVLATLLFAAACTQEMSDQRRYDTYEPAERLPGGHSALPLVEGTVPLQAVRRPDPPPAWSMKVLERGRDRYEIFCLPCHGRYGDGDGVIASYDFPQPPGFHSARLRAVPDVYFYGAITNGFGRMYDYADRIAPDDRWAITGYVRALQLSRHASVSRYPSIRDRLPDAEALK